MVGCRNTPLSARGSLTSQSDSQYLFPVDVTLSAVYVVECEPHSSCRRQAMLLLSTACKSLSGLHVQQSPVMSQLLVVVKVQVLL
jgi:hypothetical protein